MNSKEKLKIYKNETSHEIDANIVMLHGYGANGRDLMGISQIPHFQKSNYNWYFPEAPLSPPELAAFGGRAWFNLSLQSFIECMETRNFEKFYQADNQEFSTSLDLITESIWDLDLKGKKLIGGFSQGAMMAAQMFFRDPSAFDGLVLFSGAPFQYKLWKNSTDLERKFTFLSHGAKDPVIPPLCGHDFETKLKEMGLPADLMLFSGGHEIPLEVISSFAKRLEQFIGN